MTQESQSHGRDDVLACPEDRSPFWCSPYFKVLALLALLYIFFLSIGLIGSAAKLFGKGFAEQLIVTTSNPMVGLLIGILATSVIQSSSTTTSLVVGFVGANALNLANAIPIVMGANIGTSVTNTLVSIGHITRKDEFKRAFAASTVHDFFNVLAVIVLFPLQYFTNFLGIASTFLANEFQHVGGLKFSSPIKLVVSPTQHFIVDLTGGNGIITLIIAVLLLFTALRYLVVTLKSIFVGKMEVLIDQYIFKTPVRSMLFGLILTVMVQSSSITTSMAVPLAGAGILTLAQIFPYTLGANVGTTVTAFLASLATNNVAAIAVAFTHFLFNICGIILLYPLKVIPISCANKLAELSIKNKLIPLLYILIVFFLLPLGLIYLTR